MTRVDCSADPNKISHLAHSQRRGSESLIQVLCIHLSSCGWYGSKKSSAEGPSSCKVPDQSAAALPSLTRTVASLHLCSQSVLSTGRKTVSRVAEIAGDDSLEKAFCAAKKELVCESFLSASDLKPQLADAARSRCPVSMRLAASPQMLVVGSSTSWIQTANRPRALTAHFAIALAQLKRHAVMPLLWRAASAEWTT